MKIILKAFGYLQSDVMEVPENTTPEFKLELLQPIKAVYGFHGDDIGEIKPINTMAEFIWNGKSVAISGQLVKEYVLKDIYKQ